MSPAAEQHILTSVIFLGPGKEQEGARQGRKTRAQDKGARQGRKTRAQDKGGSALCRLSMSLNRNYVYYIH